MSFFESLKTAFNEVKAGSTNLLDRPAAPRVEGAFGMSQVAPPTPEETKAKFDTAITKGKETVGKVNEFAKTISRGMASYALGAGEAPVRLGAGAYSLATGNEKAGEVATTIVPPTTLPGILGKWLGPIQSPQSIQNQDIANGMDVRKATIKALTSQVLDNPAGVEISAGFKGGAILLGSVFPKFFKGAEVLKHGVSGEEFTVVKTGADDTVIKSAKTGEELTIKNSDLEAKFKQLETKGADGGPNVPVREEIGPDGTMKRTSFSKQVENAPKTAPKVADAMETSLYKVMKNPETLARAEARLAADGLDESIRKLREDFALGRANPENFTVGQRALDNLQTAGRYDEAITLADDLAQAAKTAGQAIQSLAMYSRLTPEGVLLQARRKVTQAGVDPKVITPEVAKDLTTKARKIQGMADDTPDLAGKKALEAAKLQRDIEALIPTNMLKKIATIQTIAQLLNPKTILRNVIGNTGLATAEAVAHNIFTTPIDMATALVTGKRSRVYTNTAGISGRGFVNGLKEGIEDAYAGVNRDAAFGQYNLHGNTFSSPVGKYVERTLSAVLSGPDRAFYKATYESSVANQVMAYAKNNKIKGTLEEIIAEVPKKELDKIFEVAHYDGLYRTFQDPSALAKGLSGIKNALNGGKDFGIGDFVIKYPNIPGNLINRGLAYSPAGFVKTLFEAVKPLIGKEFNQKAFTESFGRALAGTTGLVGAGALMHRLGIITGERDDNTSADRLNKTVGLGAYKINASAAKRFILSGFDEKETKLQDGDSLVSYDWFQPLAIGISMGANIDDKEAGVGSFLGDVLSGVDTVGEQAVLKNLTDIFKYKKGLSDAAIDVLKNVPASFIPTLSNQIRTVVDDNKRITYAGGNDIQETLNMVKNKIPGLSDNLPSQVDSFGMPISTFDKENTSLGQTGFNIFNAFVNPAFKSEYVKTPEGELALELYNRTGESTVLPRTTQKSLVVNGERHQLTAAELHNAQTITGVLSRNVLNALATDANFQKLPDDKKAKIIGNILTDIGSATKVIALGDRPKKPDSGLIQMLEMYRKDKKRIDDMLVKNSK